MKFIQILLMTLLMACGGAAETETSEAAQTPSKDREKYTEIYDNGQIKIQGWERDGKRVGPWVSFYENGIRWSESEYRDGMREGKSVTYYPNGAMRYRGAYVADEKAGIWIFYDEEGKVIREENFNEQ